MKRVRKSIRILGVVVGLACASYATTSMQWDGGFPGGEFRLNVRDTGGNPVEAARLTVYRAGKRELAFGYPLDNHVSGHELASDSNGRITAIRMDDGLQFGGHGWFLFWIIPMGDKAPRFDCEITAPGYKPLRFELEELFRSPHKFYDDFPKTRVNVGGKEHVLKIYENTFMLRGE